MDHSKMTKYLFSFALPIMIFAFGSHVNATPRLQLDILGGHYNSHDHEEGSEETIISNDEQFTLLALLTGHGQRIPPLENYFLSISLAPLNGSAFPPDAGVFDAGSFDIGLNSYQADESHMSFGAPANNSLPSHGIYDRYFMEFMFDFDPGHTTTRYNSEDHAGGSLFNESGNGSYFRKFDINLSSLSRDYDVHFDLYNKRRNGNVYKFAPFSHDAEYRPGNGEYSQVPEPLTIALLGLGFISIGFMRSRRKK